MIKIVTIVGARPQFVKAAVVSRLLSERNDVEEILIHTGQHFDSNMSEVFFTDMNIPKPKYELDIHSLDHGAMTGRMIEALENVLKIENPDWVLVYGDTNSTLAGALAAKKLNIKLAHVEAGLRSYNMKMPEEINRILTDRISDILFAPTQSAIDNLNKEGFENFNTQVILSGDVMKDACDFYSNLAESKSKLEVGMTSQEFVLCTIHRQENTADPERLKSIITALNKISEDVKVILPIHPGTKKRISDLNLVLNAEIIDPVGYFEMIQLLKHCKYVMTDSGGLQKEAFFFGKFCLTLRDETEWVELVQNKVNILVGADSAKIISTAQSINLLENNFGLSLYGKGNAGERIVEELLRYDS